MRRNTLDRPGPARQHEPAQAAAAIADAGASSDSPVESTATTPAVIATSHLRRTLLGLDTVAALFAWVLALAAEPSFRQQPLRLVGVAATATAVTLLVFRSKELYLSRVCAVRSVEVGRLLYACAMSGALFLVAEAVAMDAAHVRTAASGAVVTFLVAALLRGIFSRSVSSARGRGKFSRPIVVVASGRDGGALVDLLSSHPELGYRVAGVVSPADLPLSEVDGPWLGAHTLDVVRAAGANGVVIAASGVPSGTLNRLVRTLTAANVHVQLSVGLVGIDSRRLRSVPLAHEPFLYLERPVLSSWQVLLKRALDVAIGTVALLATAPLLALIAAAIWLQDRGPVLYRSERIGEDGKPFTMYKFRTMTIDADTRLAELAHSNARTGPLFKAAHDPRVTRAGRFLRAASLDELPQLWNVLRGSMSLVGPRPALAREVAEFDLELSTSRHSVRPGITGLWQMEARDNPSFSAYRRLDIFYVENWSMWLDLAILGGTAQSVAVRAVVGCLRALRDKSPSPALQDSPAPTSFILE